MENAKNGKRGDLMVMEKNKGEEIQLHESVSEFSTSSKTESEKPPVEPQEGKISDDTKYIYIGPTLPRHEIKHNAIYEGTMQEITAYLAEIIERYPQVKRLIVPIQQLGEASVKVKCSGNILNQYYNETVSVANHPEKGEE